MTIAVLGANGFLGRNICRRYLANGDTVFAFYHNNSSSIPVRCSKHKVDSLPNVSLDCLFISVGSHASAQKEFLDQYRLIETAMSKLEVKRLVFISSIAVYGNHKDAISINSSYNNPSTYGLSKLSQEFLVSSFSSYAIVRPTYLYGTGMSSNSLLPKLVQSAIEKNQVNILGQGSRKNDYVHVDDLVELCYLCSLSSDNFTLIGATGTSYSNAEVAEEIRLNIPQTAINYQGEDNNSSFSFDITATTELTGWKPKIDFKTGFKDYISRCLS